MALDNKMDKPTEYVRVPVLATELVAGCRGELISPQSRLRRLHNPCS